MLQSYICTSLHIFSCNTNQIWCTVLSLNLYWKTNHKVHYLLYCTVYIYPCKADCILYTSIWIVYCTVYGLYTVLYMYCILYMYTVYVLYIICWLIPELTLRIRVWTKTFVFLILQKCFPPYFCVNATNLYKISSRQKIK